MNFQNKQRVQEKIKLATKIAVRKNSSRFPECAEGLPKRSRDFPEAFWGCSRVLSRVLRALQEASKAIPGVLEGCKRPPIARPSQGLARTLQGPPRGPPRGLPGGPPGASQARGLPGAFLEGPPKIVTHGLDENLGPPPGSSGGASPIAVVPVEYSRSKILNGLWLAPCLT